MENSLAEQRQLLRLVVEKLTALETSSTWCPALWPAASTVNRE